MTRRSRSRGYTLLELMLSAAILAIGLTALVRSFTAGMNVLRQNEKRAIGVVLAQQKLAEIMGMDELADGAEDGDVEEDVYEGYRWQSEIETLTDYPNLKQVRVTISWRDGQRVEDVRIDTYVRVPPESGTAAEES